MINNCLFSLLFNFLIKSISNFSVYFYVSFYLKIVRILLTYKTHLTIIIMKRDTSFKSATVLQNGCPEIYWLPKGNCQVSQARTVTFWYFYLFHSLIYMPHRKACLQYPLHNKSTEVKSLSYAKSPFYKDSPKGFYVKQSLYSLMEGNRPTVLSSTLSFYHTILVCQQVC